LLLSPAKIAELSVDEMDRQRRIINAGDEYGLAELKREHGLAFDPL
jgi:hypothetical protein